MIGDDLSEHPDGPIQQTVGTEIESIQESQVFQNQARRVREFGVHFIQRVPDKIQRDKEPAVIGKCDGVDPGAHKLPENGSVRHQPAHLAGQERCEIQRSVRPESQVVRTFDTLFGTELPDDFAGVRVHDGDTSADNTGDA